MTPICTPARRIDALKPWYAFRSAITGKYVTRWYAFNHPYETMKERRHRGPKAR